MYERCVTVYFTESIIAEKWVRSYIEINTSTLVNMHLNVGFVDISIAPC